MQPDPDTQQRIGEAVALLARCDQVDVFEPREVILRRPWRPLQAQRNLGERQAFFFRENFENGLERAVAARAMQAQFVCVAAGLAQASLGCYDSGERTSRVGCDMSGQR